MDGLFIVDKPAGCTSHDVVLRVRKALKMQRVGHAGTLDPGATGILLIAVGQATRLFPFLAGHDKTYEGTIRFGFATDTYDASGRPTSEESPAVPAEEAVRTAARKFLGEILQTPPPYSAKKVGGKPGYKLARANRDVSLKPAPVIVRSLDIRRYMAPVAEFELTCSSGTYVRAIAHDLGRMLGCGAHLVSLRRLSVGEYGITDAVPVDRLEAAIREGRADALLRPLERLLPDVPAVAVRVEAAARVRNGSPLFADHLACGEEDPAARPDQALWRIMDSSGNLLALARRIPESSGLHPFLVIHR